MQAFYKKVLISFLCLLLVSSVFGYVCLQNRIVTAGLLPAGKSDWPWFTEINTDAHQGGLSRLTVLDDRFSLNFSLQLSHQAQYPYAAATLVFGDREQVAMVDWSRFDKISFDVKCAPANVLSFSLLTFDDEVSTEGDYLSYRSPATFFSCNESWARVELDLTRLETPQWWHEVYKVELSRKAYQLDKVAKLSIGNSVQSPFDVGANIQVSEIRLSGHNWFYIYLMVAGLLGLWGGYGFWLFRLHANALVQDLKEKLQRDRPLLAYQQLSVEPHRDKDKSAILHFMATQYANADLTLDAMVTSIGVSRTKINDILKSELGFTFTGYLNKLRLTEAARLLAETEDANIAEIAYSVGYKNVSYFNKLFKEEYNCTPKAFKGLSNKAGAGEDQAGD